MIYREAGQFRTSYAADQAVFPILQDRIFVWGIAFVAFFIVPFLASEYLLRAILVPFLILAIAAIGLNLLVGYCGQISLGSAAFMAVGAYASYDVTVHLPWLNLLLVFALGGLCAGAWDGCGWRPATWTSPPRSSASGRCTPSYRPLRSAPSSSASPARCGHL